MDFSQADAALDAKFSDEQAAPAEAKDQGQSVEASTDKAPTTENIQGDVPDLSKLGKFILDGKEITYKDLVSQRMRQEDYTRKTQELADQRRQFDEQSRYATNLNIDLEKVLQDPRLVNEFKRIYPKEYHSLVDSILGRIQPSQGQSQGQPAATQEQVVDKAVMQRLENLEKTFNQREVEALTTKLDATFERLKGRYPHASEETVMARLDVLNSQKVPLTDDKIEEVFKQFHDTQLKTLDSYHKEQIKKQQEAHKKAKDVPAGGGVPGQAPVKRKLFGGQIEEDLINHLRGQNLP